MKAYKVTNPDYKCKDTLFEIGKTYTHKGSLKLCESGFHFCRNLSNCFNYYNFDPQNHVFEIDVIGDVVGDENDKECTNKLKIICEIKWEEVLKLCNTGDRNTGDRNTGDCNTGDRNTGDSNTGDSNTGYSNTGNSNTGNWNTGNRNTGNWNTGNWNTGYSNTGDSNTGNWNTGDRNTGDCNTGNWNTGDRNTGNWNTGNWNTGNSNTGILNQTDTDYYRVFDEWITKEKYENIYFPRFLYFEIIEFVPKEKATDEEKKIHKQELEIFGNFFKKHDYKEAFKKSWQNADKEDRIKIKDIPGFTKKKFFEISGINIDKD
jgi:hypothetical protein